MNHSLTNFHQKGVVNRPVKTNHRKTADHNHCVMEIKILAHPSAEWVADGYGAVDLARGGLAFGGVLPSFL